MTKNNTTKLMTLLIAGLFTTHVFAEITFNGFATIATGKMSEEDAEYQGMTDEISFKELSLFALQATSDLSEGLSATAQIIARGSEEYKAEFEWAYIKYYFTDNLDIKVGRLRLPTYYYSEYIDVSYAYHWIKPPEEFYNSVLTSYDGVSLLYADSLGAVDYTIQLGSGKSEETLEGGTFSGDYKVLLNIDFMYKYLNTKLIYQETEISLNAPSLNLVQGVFPDYPGVFNIQNNEQTITGIAAYLDFDSFFIGMEYAQVRVDGIKIVIPDDDRILATAGYRVNDWTFHYTYGNSQKDNDIDVFDESDPRYSIAFSIGGSNATETQTHTLGIVYNFHPNASFKFEAGNVDVDLTDVNSNFVRSGIAVVF